MPTRFQMGVRMNSSAGASNLAPIAAALKAQDFQVARDLCEQALAAGDDTWALHHYCAFTLFSLGDTAGSIDHARRAVHLDPRQAISLRLLAGALARNGEL